ncbi:hypothetical protein NQ314_006301 [Rhamnusium bicolor]|uniref:Small-subunit processome Utp12 domain-containing protein n=1 Tax=Rhamnusium bicolor TaxID=1586634 RepID=A0AAV8Z5I1_9CUCU|nr:hypothetical protein NQ314_006301 [Rhamnusium bicolor]
MKFAYKFNNLLGTVYRKGDLLFTPDGNSVISTVGNRISIFDLKKVSCINICNGNFIVNRLCFHLSYFFYCSNKSTTLPVESRFNYNTIDLSPNGCTLIAVNEEGEAHMISLISQSIIHKYRFKRKVRAVKFSPDGKHFAVCKENNVFVFKAPGPFSGEYNAFIMERVFHGAYDETTCLDWSTDSKILAVGSKDMSTKLYPIDKWANFRIYSLGNHTDGIVGCFFEEDSYDMTTIGRNGQACIWECTIDPKDLVPLDKAPPKKKKKISSDSEEDDVDSSKSLERTEEEITAALNDMKVNGYEPDVKEVNKLFYKRVSKHYLADEVRKDNREAVMTAAAYNRTTKILVTGYSTGAFFIHELPEVNLIHSLSISEEKISSIALNSTGDWIALGCSGLGQLLVWEWQSETYIMKQQGHSSNMSCVSYSTDGQLLATGGEDGKVKLWNVHSGFCFVTFSEHSNAISAITFSGNKKFVVSASLDGTVRAYDVIRYRNFRTFTSTRPVQFSCVDIDSSGEFVAAGGQDIFEIYLWSVKTGRLLEILAGHEGPVSSLAFSPTITSTTLTSVSWDKTLRIWDAIEKGSAHETIELTADGICVVFKPNGQDVAVATLDGQISTFNIKTSLQISSIEGRNDLGSGRSDSDLITSKKTLQAKCFTSLCYSADGECLLAGGQSKNVCIYNVKESLLLRKFEITQNRSLDAVDDFINRRKLTEYGNIALVEEREETEGGNVTVKLPGVRKGDMASRIFKPEEEDHINGKETIIIVVLYVEIILFPALTMSMKLNEANLIQEVIENIPVRDIELIISNLGEQYIQRLLIIIASCLDSSKHLEYYLCWAQHILTIHGPKINAQKNIPSLLALEKSLVRKYEQISKICDYNKYTLQYVATLGEIFSKKPKEDKMELENDGGEEQENYESDNENIESIN